MGLDRLRERVTSLPYQVEMVVVIAIVFGSSIAASLLSVAHPPTHPPISEGSLIALLIIEPVLALAALSFLWLRGWRLDSLGLRANLKGTFEGIGLAVVAWLAYAIVFNAAVAVMHLDAQHMGVHLVAPGISLMVALAVSILNPLFEETFVAGYIVSTLKRQGLPWLGINLSAAVRLSYHLYQGQLGIISVVPLGLIFAGWYCRSGRLWPLVVAHGIFDFTGLMFSR